MDNWYTCDIGMYYLLPRLTIKLLLPNVTSQNQPEDTGVVVDLKVD